MKSPVAFFTPNLPESLRRGTLRSLHLSQALVGPLLKFYRHGLMIFDNVTIKETTQRTSPKEHLIPVLRALTVSTD